MFVRAFVCVKESLRTRERDQVEIKNSDCPRMGFDRELRSTSGSVSYAQ